LNAKSFMLCLVSMERIDPLEDHRKLSRFEIGKEIAFEGKPYKLLRRTTLASGEPAVVLQGQGKQFVVPATRFLKGAGQRIGGAIAQ